MLTSQAIGNICQGAVIPICLVAYLPQWRAIISNRSSENISLSAQLIWIFATLLTIAYAAIQYNEFGSCYILLVSSGINLACQCFTAALIFNFRAKKQTAQYSDIDNLGQMISELDRAAEDIKKIEEVFEDEPTQVVEINRSSQQIA